MHDIELFRGVPGSIRRRPDGSFGYAVRCMSCGLTIDQDAEGSGTDAMLAHECQRLLADQRGGVVAELLLMLAAVAVAAGAILALNAALGVVR